MGIFRTGWTVFRRTELDQPSLDTRSLWSIFVLDKLGTLGARTDRERGIGQL